jgi:hypothetical protein
MITEVAEAKVPKKELNVTKEKKNPIYRISHHKGHGRVSSTVCMNKGEEVIKVARSKTEKLLREGWKYCSKSKWREVFLSSPDTKRDKKKLKI